MAAVEAQPNRYWKVMTPKEQSQRVRQMEREQALVEERKIEDWKKEERDREKKKREKERELLRRSWEARQPKQKPDEPLISDKEGGLLVLGAAVCCALAAPLTAAGVAFGLLIVGGHFSD